jgi:hypothetical protein
MPPAFTLGLPLNRRDVLNSASAPSPSFSIMAGRSTPRSHKIFRLVEMYYDALGETLTLRRSLGAGFSCDVERAWNSALSSSSRARLRVVASRD